MHEMHETIPGIGRKLHGSDPAGPVAQLGLKLARVRCPVHANPELARLPQPVLQHHAWRFVAAVVIPSRTPLICKSLS
jgi:hypothetical protein